MKLLLTDHESPEWQFSFLFQNLSNVVAYTQSGLIVQCRKWFIKKQDIWFQDKGAHQGSPARTLILEPDILLLDEPFSALDYQTRLRVGDDIGQILKKEKKTAILVTHDLSEAISLADRIIILTSRPATVHQTVPLIFNLKDDTPLNRRNAQEFKNYFSLIWKELNSDA